MTPKVTIGIPTFNRAHFLSQSLGSALSQSLHDVEILVSDNASTDTTEALVAATGEGRVRYVKQATNIGAIRNFQALMDLASAEYFCLLQDDDMIFPDLASRACAALQQNPDAAWYAAYAFSKSDIGLAYNAELYGPPFRLDWQDGHCRKIDGDLLLPMCLFLSPAIPPVTVYRTDLIRKAFRAARVDNCPLFGERIWVAEASHGSRVIVDPYVGGWFRFHPEQACAVMQRQAGALQREWLIMREAIAAIVGGSVESVTAGFTEYLREIPAHTLSQWAGMLGQATWRNPFDERILALLRRHAAPTPTDRSLKSVVRRLTPPVLWEFVRDHVVPPPPRPPV